MKHTVENCLAVLFAMINDRLKKASDHYASGQKDMGDLYTAQVQAFRNAYNLFKDEKCFKNAVERYFKGEENVG